MAALRAVIPAAYKMDAVQAGGSASTPSIDSKIASQTFPLQRHQSLFLHFPIISAHKEYG